MTVKCVKVIHFFNVMFILSSNTNCVHLFNVMFILVAILIVFICSMHCLY